MTATSPIQPTPKAIRAGQREGARGALAGAGTPRATTGVGTNAWGRGGATGIAAGGGGGGGGAKIVSGSGSATSTIASGSGGGAS